MSPSPPPLRARATKGSTNARVRPPCLAAAVIVGLSRTQMEIGARAARPIPRKSTTVGRAGSHIEVGWGQGAPFCECPPSTPRGPRRHDAGDRPRVRRCALAMRTHSPRCGAGLANGGGMSPSPPQLRARATKGSPNARVRPPCLMAAVTVGLSRTQMEIGARAARPIPRKSTTVGRAGSHIEVGWGQGAPFCECPPSTPRGRRRHDAGDRPRVRRCALAMRAATAAPRVIGGSGRAASPTSRGDRRPAGARSVDHR